MKVINAAVAMKFWFLNRSLTILLSTVAVVFNLQAQDPATKKPNIVIILADDMGYGDVSSNNPLARVSTPHIDQLGRTGIRFTDAHSGGSVCTPSRYGLLTGRYFFRVEPKKAHWGYLSPLIEEKRETIGSLLKKAGYTTACIGKWHLGLHWFPKDSTKPLIPDERELGYTNVDFSKPAQGGPNALGFDYSYILPASLDMPPYVFLENDHVTDSDIILTADAYPSSLEHTIYSWDRKRTSDRDIYWDRGVWWRNGEMSRSFNVESCLDSIVNRGISFIEDQVKMQPDKPFMLYLPLTGPHTPWVPNERFKGSSPLGTYGDFINQIDDVVYQVEETLKREGIHENTLLIFTSDNGAPWAEEDIQVHGHRSNWGRRGQKGDAWDGGHHVPLFISWPEGIKQSGNYDHTVSLVDLIATFADIAGQKIAWSNGEDSYSFIEVLNGQLDKPTRDHLIYVSSSGTLAIKKGSWKLIDGLGSGGFTAPSVVKPEVGGPSGQLYDLNADSFEQNNLYLRKTEKVAEMTNMLRKIKEQGYSRKP